MEEGSRVQERAYLAEDEHELLYHLLGDPSFGINPLRVSKIVKGFLGIGTRKIHLDALGIYRWNLSTSGVGYETFSEFHLWEGIRRLVAA